jgi:hypothetical protein
MRLYSISIHNSPEWFDHRYQTLRNGGILWSATDKLVGPHRFWFRSKICEKALRCDLIDRREKFNLDYSVTLLFRSHCCSEKVRGISMVRWDAVLARRYLFSPRIKLWIVIFQQNMEYCGKRPSVGFTRSQRFWKIWLKWEIDPGKPDQNKACCRVHSHWSYASNPHWYSYSAWMSWIVVHR